MRRLLRLAEEERTQRRTVADAMAILRSIPSRPDELTAQIRVSRLRLLSEQVVGLIDVELPVDEDAAYAVSLPLAAEFLASRPECSQPERFDVTVLDRAAVDAENNVWLSGGNILRAVEVIAWQSDWSDLDWRIIFNLISMLKAENHCIRSWRDQVPAAFTEMVPAHLMSPDIVAISQLEAPPLKVLRAYIADHDKSLKTPSLQKISDALAAFGVRQPAPRPRKRRHHSAAI